MVEIEIQTERNSNLFFEPLHRTVRGRFDFMRVGEPSGKAQSKWPMVIPGQRLGINQSTGEGWIEEPLHDERHQAVRDRLTAAGKRLPPRRETFRDVHVASWLHRMQRAVEDGLAIVVDGEFPAELPGKPRESFITSDTTDPQAEMMQQLAVSLDRLATALTTLQPAKGK